MLQRLANVNHWFCILLGVGWGVIIYSLTAPVQSTDSSLWWIMLSGAAALWALGWIINYVLTGRTTLIPE